MEVFGSKEKKRNRKSRRRQERLLPLTPIRGGRRFETCKSEIPTPEVHFEWLRKPDEGGKKDLKNLHGKVIGSGGDFSPEGIKRFH